MAGNRLSCGLNPTKKSSGARPQPVKRKPIFDEEDDSDEGSANLNEIGVEEIGEIGQALKEESTSIGLSKASPAKSSGSKPKFNGVGSKSAPVSMYSDLSSSFTSKKHAENAEELDSTIYDYDAVYDSLKPHKKITLEDKERKPKYMTNLLAAAAIRKRDATIAEEKKLAREREAEGEEFVDKEKFVTSAYKKQQKENRRLEEEERIREEQERRKNKGTGMTNFYKSMLEKGEQKHAEIVKAAEERLQRSPKEEIEGEKEKTEADLAREINEKNAGAITVNDEGQVVDKRQLLKGGLNLVPKAKGAVNSNLSRGNASMSDRSRGSGFVGAGGGKHAMRERQSRMMEAQLEQATKRALEEEEAERLKVERASKSRKTEGDIMNAKERYLARKREAEKAEKGDALPLNNAYSQSRYGGPFPTIMNNGHFASPGSELDGENDNQEGENIGTGTPIVYLTHQQVKGTILLTRFGNIWIHRFQRLEHLHSVDALFHPCADGWPENTGGNTDLIDKLIVDLGLGLPTEIVKGKEGDFKEALRAIHYL